MDPSGTFFQYDAKAIGTNLIKVEDMSIILYNEPNYAHILIGPCLWLEDKCLNYLPLTKFRVFSHKTIEMNSMLPWFCLVTDPIGHQNVVRTAVTHLSSPHVSFWCFYHILMSSMICY